jgi:type I restriction enzyme S subunit
VNFRFPNYENTPFNEETGLPEGWENCRLTEIFDIQGGTQPPKSEWKEIIEDGYVRMIQIRDYYTDSHIGFVKDKSTLKKCNKEDIMIARYGASVGRICWGLDGAYNVALAKVIPFKKHYSSFLRWFLISDYFQSSLLGMTQRTAQDGFNKETFNSIYAIKPDETTLMQFENIELNIFLQIEKLKEKNKKVKEARDILLPRLMNRTIEV